MLQVGRAVAWGTNALAEIEALNASLAGSRNASQRPCRACTARGRSAAPTASTAAANSGRGVHGLPVSSSAGGARASASLRPPAPFPQLILVRCSSRHATYSGFDHQWRGFGKAFLDGFLPSISCPANPAQNALPCLLR